MLVPPREAPKNVYGLPLQKCSKPGMAPTGYDRSGRCAEHAGDLGSHHVCVADIGKRVDGKTFCEATGQSDWCSEGDRESWCVCEWAFEKHARDKGCEALTIDCEATNQLALEHYKQHGSDKMVDCVLKQCFHR